MIRFPLCCYSSLSLIFLCHCSPLSSFVCFSSNSGIPLVIEFRNVTERCIKDRESTELPFCLVGRYTFGYIAPQIINSHNHRRERFKVKQTGVLCSVGIKTRSLHLVSHILQQLVALSSQQNQTDLFQNMQSKFMFLNLLGVRKRSLGSY